VTDNDETEKTDMTYCLTLEETAQYLKMGTSTLYDLPPQREHPVHKMGRESPFDAAELDE